MRKLLYSLVQQPLPEWIRLPWVYDPVLQIHETSKKNYGIFHTFFTFLYLECLSSVHFNIRLLISFYWACLCVKATVQTVIGCSNNNISNFKAGLQSDSSLITAKLHTAMYHYYFETCSLPQQRYRIEMLSPWQSQKWEKEETDNGNKQQKP